jgi:hypothetical protein
LRTLLVEGFLVLLLRTKWQDEWQLNDTIAWFAALGVGGFVLWAALDHYAEQGTGGFAALSLMLVAAGTSVVEILSGSALLSLFAACLSAVLMASLVVSYWKGAPSLTKGAVSAAVLLLIGFWLTDYFYGDMPAASAVLLALAPLMASQLDLVVARKTQASGAALLSIVVSLIAIGLAAFLAWKSAPMDESTPFNPESACSPVLEVFRSALVTGRLGSVATDLPATIR